LLLTLLYGLDFIHKLFNVMKTKLEKQAQKYLKKSLESKNSKDSEFYYTQYVETLFKSDLQEEKNKKKD